MTLKTAYKPLAFAGTLLIVLLFLSVQIKTIGDAALRPLHYAGIFVLFPVVVISVPVLIRWMMSATTESKLILAGFVALYAYMALKTVGMPERVVKDFLIGSAVVWGLLIGLSVAYLRGREEGRDYIRLTTSVTFFLTLTFAVLAWLMYFDWITLRIGETLFTHNPVWGVRIHGLLGEPTHLGAAVGVGVIAGLYLLATCNSRWAALGYLIALLLLGAGLYGSGSRNGFLSMVVGAMMLLIHMRGRRGALLLGLAVVLVGGMLLAQSSWALKTVSQVGEAAPVSQVGEAAPVSQGGEAAYFSALKDSLRIGDPNGSVRLRKFGDVIEIFRQSDVGDWVWGAGNGHLRHVYGTAFNNYLESLVDFGAGWVIALLAYLVYLYRCLRAAVLAKNDRAAGHASFAIALLAFAAVFALNLITLFPTFFHFANFSLIVAVAIGIVLSAENYRAADQGPRSR